MMRSIRPARSPRPASASHAAAPLIDHLEPRTLMSSAITSIGLTQTAAGAAVVWATGSLNNDNTVTGSATVATFNSVLTDQPIDLASITFGPNQTLSLTRAAGFAPYTSQYGTDFRFGNSERTVGIHSGAFDDGAGDAGNTLRYLIERENRYSGWGFSGDKVFTIQKLEITADGVRSDFDVLFLTNFSNGVPTRIRYSEDGSNQRSVFKNVTSFSPDGVLRFGNGEALILGRSILPVSANGGSQFVGYIDTDTSDGEVGFGGGTGSANGYRGVLPGDALPEVVYRGTVTALGPQSAAFFDVPSGAGFHDVVLVIKTQEQFSLYTAAAYDSQGPALRTGTWVAAITGRAGSFDPGQPWPDVFIPQLLLRDAANTIVRFQLGRAFTLGAGGIGGNDTPYERFGGLLGARTALSVANDVPLTAKYVEIDQNGSPILYAQSDPNGPRNVWRAIDLIAVAGGQPLASAVLNRGSSTIGDVSVDGVTTSGQIVRYLIGTLATNVQSATFLNESTDADSSVNGLRFARGATVIDRPGIDGVSIAGTREDGAFVVATRSQFYATARWEVTNVSASLQSADQAEPDWSLPRVGLVTAWGAVHLFLRTAAGDIVAIWTAPQADRWYVNNLTQIAGAPALTGTLSPLATDWNALHIHALDAQGNLGVLWWAPELQGAWRFNNLTDELAGPRVALTTNGAPAALPAWNRLGDIHIAGIDDEGNTRLYWWSSSTGVWSIGNLTATTPPLDRPTSLIRQIGDQGDITGSDPHQIFARAAGGDLLQVYWRSTPADEWLADSVTRRLV